MSPVPSSSLINAPTVVSEIMPGVISRFVELGQGMVAGVYRGDGTRSSQAAMTNDMEYVYFSCLLAGKVETQTTRFLLAPAVGSGHIGYLTRDKFVVRASEHFRQVEVMVPPETLAELAGEDADWLYQDLKQGPFLRDTASGQQAVEAALRLSERIECGDSSLMMLKAAALEFLAWRIGHPSSSAAANSERYTLPLRERKLLLAARDRLLQDLTTPPTIAELAREIGLNQFKLKRGFKLLFGTSIYALFLRERMNRARQLLRQHNVGDTAQMLGYSNVSHFSKAFQNQFGLNPGQARKDAV